MCHVIWQIYFMFAILHKKGNNKITEMADNNFGCLGLLDKLLSMLTLKFDYNLIKAIDLHQIYDVMNTQN